MITLLRKLGGNPLAPDFEWDCTLRESATAEYDISEHLIELQGTESDHIYRKPKQWEGEGLVTATPLDDAPGLERMQRIVDALVTLADLEQVVIASSETWQKDVLIKRVEWRRDQGTGRAARVSMVLQEAGSGLVAGQTAQIPPSRLQAGKIRRTHTSGAKGGGAGGPLSKTSLKHIGDGFVGLFGGG